MLIGEYSNTDQVRGTAFIIGYPINKDKAIPILVTAAHVLDSIKSEIAYLILRKEREDSTWEEIYYEIKIRDQEKNLYVKHDSVDVAVMWIQLPEWFDDPIIPIDFLAEDSIFQQIGIHPGDEIMCLGYPLGKKTGPFGFPILQSGKIATYPLIPTKKIKTFIGDFKISKGYSGGPVYLYNPMGRRVRPGMIDMRREFAYILGLVSTMPITQEEFDKLIEEEKKYYFGFARIVHASLIKETIEKLISKQND